MRLSKNLFIIMCVAVAIVFTACSKENDNIFKEDVTVEEVAEDPEYPVEINGTEIKSRPNKIISLAPALTEKIYDLNMEDRLIGVSDFCDYPEDAEDTEKFGTFMLPDMEAIKEASPHVIVSETALDEAFLEELEKEGIAAVTIPRANSIEELKSNYIALAKIMEGKKSGEELGEAAAKKLQKSLDEIAESVSPYVDSESQKNILYLRLLDFNVATGDTLENELFSLLGFNNIAKDEKEWIFPKEEAESADGKKLFSEIDIIFCDENDVDIKMLEQNSFYKVLPAVLKDRYLYIDSKVFERQSMRITEVLEVMAEYAYPEMNGGESTENTEEQSAS